MTGVAEALATQAGNSEVIIRTFEQVQGQAVAGDAEPVADRSHVREDVERRRRVKRVNSVDLIEPFRQQNPLLAKLLHDIVVHDNVVLTIFPIASAIRSPVTQKPSRQPLMLYDLLKV